MGVATDFNHIVEVKVAGEEVSAGPVSAAGGIELHLPRGRCLVVRRGFDRQTLGDLLHVLEEGSPDSMRREGVT